MCKRLNDLTKLYTVIYNDLVTLYTVIYCTLALPVRALCTERRALCAERCERRGLRVAVFAAA